MRCSVERLPVVAAILVGVMLVAACGPFALPGQGSSVADLQDVGGVVGMGLIDAHEVQNDIFVRNIRVDIAVTDHRRNAIEMDVTGGDLSVRCGPSCMNGFASMRLQASDGSTYGNSTLPFDSSTSPGTWSTGDGDRSYTQQLGPISPMLFPGAVALLSVGFQVAETARGPYRVLVSSQSGQVTLKQVPTPQFPGVPDTTAGAPAQIAGMTYAMTRVDNGSWVPYFNRQHPGQAAHESIRPGFRYLHAAFRLVNVSRQADAAYDDRVVVLSDLGVTHYADEVLGDPIPTRATGQRDVFFLLGKQETRPVVCVLGIVAAPTTGACWPTS